MQTTNRLQRSPCARETLRAFVRLQIIACAAQGLVRFRLECRRRRRMLWRNRLADVHYHIVRSSRAFYRWLDAGKRVGVKNPLCYSHPPATSFALQKNLGILPVSQRAKAIDGTRTFMSTPTCPHQMGIPLLHGHEFLPFGVQQGHHTSPVTRAVAIDEAHHLASTRSEHSFPDFISIPL